MTRLTQRLSTVWSTVKCPRCGNVVHPDMLGIEGASPASPPQDEKRWSFLWVAPRGDICPECDFPLSKYLGRLKWIRIMTVGVTIVVIAFLLQVAGSIGQLGDAYVAVTRKVILVGAAIFAVGFVGVIIGGRHKTMRISDRQ